MPDNKGISAIKSLKTLGIEAAGLYIGGPYAASRNIVDVLHNAGLSLWLIYNNTTPKLVGGTLDSGMTEAKVAAYAAAALGAPPGTAIAADIEASWYPSREWIAGWTYGLVRHGYAPYVYGSPGSPAFVQAASGAAHEYRTVGLRLRLWVAKWASLTDAEPPSIEGVKTGAWQYDGNVSLPIGVEADLSRWYDVGALWKAEHTSVAPTDTSLPLTVTGRVDRTTDQFFFPVTLTGSKPYTMQILHDTGAFCLMLDGETAAACGAPTGGPTLEIEGVAGAAPAYWSQVDVTIGSLTWRNVPCVVDPSASGSLWGLRFYIDNGYALKIDTVEGTLTISKG
jgi:hypothetical protein